MTVNEIRAKWKEIEPKLIEHIRKGDCSKSYEDIVKLLSVLLLGPSKDYEHKFHTIDYGDYQGTQVFIFAEDIYQPDVDEIYIVSNYYGSCSGCDQLLSITDYNDVPESEDEVNDILSLCHDIWDRIRPLSALKDVAKFETQD